MKNLILTIDPGDSLGWAFSDLEEIVEGGVIKSRSCYNAKGKTNMSVRRGFRQQRKNTRRKVERNLKLLNLFNKIGWISKAKEDIVEIWKNKNVLQLRFKGLSEPLTSEEFSQVIYNYAQNRGYHGDLNELKNLLKQEQKDESSVKYTVSHLDEFDESKMFPIEFIIKNNGKKKNVLFLNKHIKAEFDHIWEVQKEFGNISFMNKDIPIDLWNEIIKNTTHKKNSKKAKKNGLKFLMWDYILNYKRPLKSSYKLKNDCPFFPNKKVTLKAFQDYQEFRIISNINNIRKEDLPLSLIEKNKLYQLFNDKDKITVKEINNILGCKKINYKSNTIFDGNRTNFFMRKHINDWFEKTKDEKDNLINLLLSEYNNKEWLINYSKKIGVIDINNFILDIGKLDKDNAPYSKKALSEIINPNLKNDLSLYDIEKNFIIDEKQINIKSINNPVVKKNLIHLDNIIQKLEKRYRLPDEIRIEAPRECNSPTKKNNIEKLNQKNRENNDLIKLELEKNNVPISSTAIRKYKLWDECNHICVYTAKEISFDDLFKTRKFDIEHILTNITDDFNNLTLCCSDFNKIKGNRTPYQLLLDGIINKKTYDQILQRVLKFKSINGNKRHLKYLNFAEELTVSDVVKKDFFSGRFINDTSYTSKLFIKYINKKYPNIKTLALKPKIVTTIRKQFELNNLLGNKFNDIFDPFLNEKKKGLPSKRATFLSNLPIAEKNRLDNRHHLVDAIALLFADSKFTHCIYNNYEEMSSPAFYNTSFKKKLIELLATVCIDYKEKFRKRGQLHDATLLKKDKINSAKIIKIDKYGNPVYAELNNNAYLVLYEDNSFKPVELFNLADDFKNKEIKEIFKKNNYYLIDNEDYKFSLMDEHDLCKLDKKIISDNLYRLFTLDSKGNASYVHHILSQKSLQFEIGKDNPDKIKKYTCAIHLSNRNIKNFNGIRINKNALFYFNNDKNKGIFANKITSNHLINSEFCISGCD